MDAAHALFQAGGVPGDVVVDHQPAELEIDALAGGVGGDETAGPAFGFRLAEEFHLPLTLLVGHAAVDQGDSPGEAEALKSPNQETGGVAMLGEDDQLFAGELRVAQDALQLLELGLLSGFVEGARFVPQLFDFEKLLLQIKEIDGYGGAQSLLFKGLLVRAPVFTRNRLVECPGLENVFKALKSFLPGADLLCAHPAVFHFIDQAFQLLFASLEGAQEGVGRARESALENAHHEAGRGPVQKLGPVVEVGDVVCRPVVQLLFAAWALRQGIAQRVAVSLWVERLFIKTEQLLLGAADEVLAPRNRGESRQRRHRWRACPAAAGARGRSTGTPCPCGVSR